MNAETFRSRSTVAAGLFFLVTLIGAASNFPAL